MSLKQTKTTFYHPKFRNCKTVTRGFSDGSAVKNLLANAGDLGSIPGSGRSPGGRKGNPLQHSYLESPMDRGAWWTHPQAHKNRTQLSAERCPQMWPREREAARLAVSSGFITRWGWTQQVPGPGARKRERPLAQPLPAPDSALGGGRTVPFPCHQFLTGPAAPAESVPASLLARPLCAQQYR